MAGAVGTQIALGTRNRSKRTAGTHLSAPFPVQVVVVTVTALLWSFRGPKKVAPLEPSKEAGAILEELTERERQR